jgi:hypothetical protein
MSTEPGGCMVSSLIGVRYVCPSLLECSVHDKFEVRIGRVGPALDDLPDGFDLEVQSTGYIHSFSVSGYAWMHGSPISVMFLVTGAYLPGELSRSMGSGLRQISTAITSSE